ncbi:uncharacterized protein LOC131936505 [Physella acuta]|uniref:uncharacterized protein LOC131936505 n=1 Tax=Physella acuta TaxID=109671 RepID=UPI0027DE4339|nr:uncharacterized protein LOC131936505 [Physella acuta]
MHGDEAREISGFIPVEVIYQHGKHGTSSIFKVEFPLSAKVEILKKDMHPRLKIPPDQQVWIYKGVPLSDSDTMLSKKIKVDDKIVVQERKAETEMTHYSDSETLPQEESCK